MSESILKTGLSRLTSILKLKESEVGDLLHEEITRQVKEIVGTPLISEPVGVAEEIDAKDISAAIAEIMTREEPPAEPKKKIFKHDGRMSWAWEVENSADNDEINYLLANHEQPVELGRYLAENLFKSVARRAAAGDAKDSYIDEEGTNLLLPHVPYSPYTDEGAAFFISLAYSWRGMAEQWNAQEQDRIKAEAAARMESERKAMEAMLAEQTNKMIEKMVKEQKERNTKSQEGHDKEVIWQASRSHDTIRAIRNADELDDLLENVGLRAGDKAANTSPYFVLPYGISNKRGMKQAEYGFHTHNPYGTAIELLLRGKDVGAIVRFMKWGEKKSVYRRNRFIKFASVNFPSKPMRETVHDVRVRQYDDRSRVGGYGEW